MINVEAMMRGMKNIRTKMIEAIFILKIDYTLKIKKILINIILIKVQIK